MCHSILGDAYSPAVTVEEILQYIQGLLMDPFPGDGLDTTKATILLDDLKNNTANYKKQAASHKEAHASLSEQEMKVKYNLTE